LDIEQACNTFAEKNENIKESIYPISTEYYNKINKTKENREQRIMIIGDIQSMKYLNSEYLLFFSFLSVNY